jgi:hypothetical protein
LPGEDLLGSQEGRRPGEDRECFTTEYAEYADKAGNVLGVGYAANGKWQMAYGKNGKRKTRRRTTGISPWLPELTRTCRRSSTTYRDLREPSGTFRRMQKAFIRKAGKREEARRRQGEFFTTEDADYAECGMQRSEEV